MRLSAAKRGQLILLIVATASGAAGYSVGRYRGALGYKTAFAAGDGYQRSADESMSSSRARDLYGRGDYAEAASEAARILIANPSDPGAYAVLQMANAKLEAQRVAFAGAASAPPGADEENTRRAVKHWHSGIIYFQAGKYAKARDEWLLCKQFDAANEDCQTGLARLDSTYGGGS